MRVVLFCHSLESDWNHGNAHFLRGVVKELQRRGHRVRVLEPRNGWSRRCLVDHDPHYLNQTKWAVEQFGVRDRVTVQRRQVYELAGDPTTYDLVLFMGVFYHLRYPLLALDIVAQRIGRQLVFQSLLQLDEEIYAPQDDYEFEERDVLRRPGWPAMAFIEKRFAHDPTNWFVPNRAGIEAMLRSAGLTIQNRIEPELYLCAPDGSDFASRCPGNPQEYAAATRAHTRED